MKKAKIVYLKVFAFLFFCTKMCAIFAQSEKVNDSAIEIRDTIICFTDKYGKHCQCDYPLTQKGFIKVSDGTNIWVEIEGKGTPLLLIQGGPMHDHRYFHHHLSALASEHTLIYTDFRGRYMSDESDPEKYNILQDLEDLEDMRKKLGIKQWNILGHSFGGYMTAIYSVLYPQSIKSAIIVSSPFGQTQIEDSINNATLLERFKDVVTQEDNITELIKLSFHSIPSKESIPYVLQTLYAYGYLQKFESLANHYLTNLPPLIEKYIGIRQDKICLLSLCLC